MARSARLPLVIRSVAIAAVVAALCALSVPADASRPGHHQGDRAGTAVRAKKGAKHRAGRCRKRGRRHARARARARRCRKGPPSSLYWGASIGEQLTGTQAPWDMNAVTSFESMAGKQLSLIHFFAPFANCESSPCSFYDFPTKAMENVRQHGAIPFFSWSSQSIPAKVDQPDFQLSDVIAGTYDSYIRSFAESARAWGHPFFLRFNWEMNGDWFAWSEGANGNRAGEYVAAWRHVHDIFTAAGATNATWTWCPNVDFRNKLQSLDSVYPGDGYVDWTCLDGYNWGTNPASPQGWMSFDEIYQSTYHEIVDQIAPGKPMVIGETAATEQGGSKSAWIRKMLTNLPTAYPKVRGLVWFDRYDSNMDWPLQSSSSAASAFANGIQDHSYVPNRYSNLAAGPIPPPPTYTNTRLTSLRKRPGRRSRS